MIIINLKGQLGNQMFQYALGRHMLELGRDVRYNKTYFKYDPSIDFALPRFFKITLPEAREDQIRLYQDQRRLLIDRIRRRVFGRRERIFREGDSDSLVFKPEVLELENSIIEGYWQSEKYFLPIKEILLKEFSFPQPSGKNLMLAQKLMQEESVSIHVRRGDYLQCGFPVLTPSYYEAAISYLTSKYNNLHFYIFSDDITWCRENLIGNNISYVDWNTKDNSPWDMWLMTQCKHNIIANSSF